MVNAIIFVLALFLIILFVVVPLFFLYWWIKLKKIQKNVPENIEEQIKKANQEVNLIRRIEDNVKEKDKLKREIRDERRARPQNSEDSLPGGRAEDSRRKEDAEKHERVSIPDADTGGEDRKLSKWDWESFK